jgi:hypothetical protein
MDRLKNFASKDQTRLSSEQLRKALMEDIKKIKQPDKIFHAYDMFHKSVDQHRTNIWTATTLVFTSLTSTAALVQAAYQTADSCPPGADKSTMKACGLAIAAASVGVVMIGISTKLLMDARSSPGKLAHKLDAELNKKLKKDIKDNYPLGKLVNLVSRFSELGQVDKDEIQAYLGAEMNSVAEQDV